MPAHTLAPAHSARRTMALVQILALAMDSAAAVPVTAPLRRSNRAFKRHFAIWCTDRTHWQKQRRYNTMGWASCAAKCVQLINQQLNSVHTHKVGAHTCPYCAKSMHSQCYPGTRIPTCITSGWSLFYRVFLHVLPKNDDYR